MHIVNNRSAQFRTLRSWSIDLILVPRHLLIFWICDFDYIASEIQSCLFVFSLNTLLNWKFQRNIIWNALIPLPQKNQKHLFSFKDCFQTCDRFGDIPNSEPPCSSFVDIVNFSILFNLRDELPPLGRRNIKDKSINQK